MVLTSIGGSNKESTSPPEPADLAVGIEKMQQAYTGFFSGPESIALPLELKAQKENFEEAFSQMQALATKLSEYQHKIGRVLAEQQPLLVVESGSGCSSGGNTNSAVIGAATGAGGDQSPAGAAEGGGPPVEQIPPQATYAAVAATRTTSPDRGAGTNNECTTTSSMQESKMQKDKRAEDCSYDELSQRRPASKAAKVDVAAAPMDVEDGA